MDEIICFDLSCSLYHSPFSGYVNTPEQARATFEGQDCRFNGATTFSYRTRRYRDFTVASKLLSYLCAASELVTFNGRTYDLIALEQLCGKDAVRPLWKVPHHDLKGWKAQSLASSVRVGLPALADTFDSMIRVRSKQLGVKGCEDQSLAGTYRDTKFTRHLFDEYVRSSETAFTFRDI